MTAPPDAGQESDVYDIVEDYTPKTPPPRTVLPVEAVVAPSVPMSGISYARRETLPPSAVDQYFPDRVRDLYMPLALIGGGTVIEAALSLFSRTNSVAMTLAVTGIYMVANTILMLLTVMVVAKIRGISFGPFVTAIIKLCGISIGPGAAGSLVSVALAWFPLGGLLGWLAGFILYFAMIGALFDLDQSDTWYVVIAVFLARVLVAVVVIAILTHL